MASDRDIAKAVRLLQQQLESADFAEAVEENERNLTANDEDPEEGD
jgi:hypothetical protein